MKRNSFFVWWAQHGVEFIRRNFSEGGVFDSQRPAVERGGFFRNKLWIKTIYFFDKGSKIV